MQQDLDNPCAIARSLRVLGERWTFLVLRDAFEGISRFDDFRDSLGVSADVLSDRLSTLVAHGVLEKVEYREPGARRRNAYVLTDAGRELFPVLAALQEWGEEHLPRPEGPILRPCERRTGAAVHVGFVDRTGREVPPEDVVLVPTETYPRARRLARRSRRDGAAGVGSVILDPDE